MKRRVWLLAGLIAAAAWAQDPADDEDLERLDDDAPVAEAPASGEAPDAAAPPDGEAAADEAVEDPLAAIEAEEQASVKATFDRFEPSEQISEDRSVAFPNDI